MRGRQRRLERKESRKATHRLRHFRSKEVERLREDALKYTLSEAVTMASIRREVAVLIGDNRGRTKMNLERGRLISIRFGCWLYEINGDEIRATKQKTLGAGNV